MLFNLLKNPILKKCYRYLCYKKIFTKNLFLVLSTIMIKVIIELKYWKKQWAKYDKV